jgi:hypothetical protein
MMPPRLGEIAGGLMMTRTGTMLAAAAAAMLWAGSAGATSFDFTYQATGLVQATWGSGSFTLAGTDGSFTKASGLDTFDMAGDYSALIVFGGSYALTKSDLQSFSATLANGELTALSFVTRQISFPVTAIGYPIGSRRLKFTLTGLETGNLSVAATSGLITTRFGGTMEMLAPLSAPEPASWATMLAGFGLLGTSLRRHRRNEAIAIRAIA